MTRPALVALSTAAVLSAAPTALAHQVTPPGHEGCTTTLHAGKLVPAHTIAMPIADARSAAISRGPCLR